MADLRDVGEEFGHLSARRELLLGTPCDFHRGLGLSLAGRDRTRSEQRKGTDSSDGHSRLFLAVQRVDSAGAGPTDWFTQGLRHTSHCCHCPPAGTYDVELDPNQGTRHMGHIVATSAGSPPPRAQTPLARGHLVQHLLSYSLNVHS